MVYDLEIQEALVKTEETPEERSNEIRLSTGVVLRFKPFPLMRIQSVADQFPYPEVPKVYNKDKEKWEPWAGSEEYANAVEEINRKRGLAVVDTVMAVGTEVVTVPEGFPKATDEDWIEELAISHIQVNRESKIARYFAWVKYVATVTEDDLVKIMSFSGKQVGTGEKNVAEQLQTHFPDN
jgi:hypothetical protein